MTVYTVSQLAQLAGISVRTLHHYDEIGLLKPSKRTAAGYRQYGQNELLRLQQILFFRELSFALNQIDAILSHPDFDLLDALHNHRFALQARSERLARLLNTIDRTIQTLEDSTMALSDEQLYEGFSKEQIERYKRDVNEQYDPKIVAETNRRARKMSPQQWQAIKADSVAITQEIADLADSDPADQAVQVLIGRYHKYIENFYPCSADMFRGLGTLYVTHDEFRAHYEQFRPNLADFMQAAMSIYADNELS